MKNLRLIPANAISKTFNFIKVNTSKQIVFSLLLMVSCFQLMSTPMIRLKMRGPINSQGETVIYYQAGATTCFDSGYDSYFIAGPNPAPHIMQQCNAINIAINGIPPACHELSVSIKVTTHLTGNFTITAEDFEELPTGTSVTLKDLATGSTVNILANPYSFLLSDTTSKARFVVTIASSPLPIHFNSALEQPTCNSVTGGYIKIAGINNGPWNYTWKDSTGNILKTSLNRVGSDSLTNLNVGIYNVEISSVNSCYLSDTIFSLKKKITPTVSFTSHDTIFAGLNNFKPTNQSINSTGYLWEFGDNSAFSADATPLYSYLLPGIYKVKLTGRSLNDCIDTLSKHITVMDFTTYIKNEMLESFKLMNLGNNQYKLKTNEPVSKQLTVSLYSLEGKTSHPILNTGETNTEIKLDLRNVNPGIYVLSVNQKDVTVLSRKIIVQ